MKKNWYEVSVIIERISENGMAANVKEKYLVDAMSFTEAEARITEELSSFGEFEIDSVVKRNLEVVFADDESDKWYKCKLCFITLDERTGREKKTVQTVMIQAIDFSDAKKKAEDYMKGAVSDWDFTLIQETQILEAFALKEDKEDKEE